MEFIKFGDWYEKSEIASRKDSLFLRIFSNNYLDKTQEFLEDNLSKVEKVRNIVGKEGEIVDFLPATENCVGNTSHRLKIKYDYGQVQNEYPEDLWIKLRS